MTVVAAELRKLPAFVRRDFLVAWSYRMSFVSDLVNLAGQALVFAFIGKMIAPSALPKIAGAQVTYLEFAAIGIAIGVFVTFGLQRVSMAIRNEQLMGTLESLLTTPTRAATLQIGSVFFDLLYIPLQTAVFLGAMAIGFDLHLDPSGILPATLVLLVFIPFVWGLGVFSAGATLTFRRGANAVAFGAIILAFGSGLYFPVELLPSWIEATAQANPVALAVSGMRDALLGGAGWSDIAGDLVILAPLSAASLAVGIAAFRVALRRERKLGTLGLY
ncbi:MAG TPA: ABC transporter permease [Gaiellaceae bacterium]|nr:ABC transporter permease [Gaiellaceae bacterium]